MENLGKNEHCNKRKVYLTQEICLASSADTSDPFWYHLPNFFSGYFKEKSKCAQNVNLKGWMILEGSRDSI